MDDFFRKQYEILKTAEDGKFAADRVSNNCFPKNINFILIVRFFGAFSVLFICFSGKQSENFERWKN